jgi:hypothetical protein
VIKKRRSLAPLKKARPLIIRLCGDPYGYRFVQSICYVAPMLAEQLCRERVLCAHPIWDPGKCQIVERSGPVVQFRVS